MDGEWEAPMIDNPEYKGEWSPKQIDNPEYKGVWQHPEIDNPEYQSDDKLYLRKEVCTIGFDLWQVKAGTIFDNILITDDIEEAKTAFDVSKVQAGEKKMKEEQDEEQRKKDEAENKENKDKDSEDEGEDGEAEEHDEL